MNILSRCKWFLFQQKYRFDLGHQSLALINFTLLVITASDKLRIATNINKTATLVAVIVLISFFCVWLFGYILDKFVKYGQAYNIEAYKRNPLMEEQMEILRRLDRKGGK